MNYQRIYEFRFAGVDQESKRKVWSEISAYVCQLMGNPARVLDPAAGSGEFILSCSAAERWAVDMVPQDWFNDQNRIKTIVSDIFKADLPPNYFDGVFISNFLEHLHNPDEISSFMEKMLQVLRPGGVFVIMGPNYKHCAKEYFDCADHRLALTQISVAEHLYAAGFKVISIKDKFLPYSFRSRLPVSVLLTRIYLKFPLLWKFFGKQFLLVGKKEI